MRAPMILRLALLACCSLCASGASAEIKPKFGGVVGAGTALQSGGAGSIQGMQAVPDANAPAGNAARYLLNALPSGRKAVEQGDGSDLNAVAALSGALARTLSQRAADVVNITDFPTLQAAFDRAWAVGKDVVIPCGDYYPSATTEAYGVGFQGYGQACVVFHASFNGPVFRSTTTGFGLQDKQIGRLTCQIEVASGAAYDKTACIEFAGDNATYVVGNYIHDIASRGAYATIVVSKANSGPGGFGYESHVSTNHWARIRAAGYSNPAKYRFWFKTGSGTANVFDTMSGGSEPVSDAGAAVFRYEGTDPQGHSVVVGDITIASSQFQGPTKVVSVGASSVYNDNINFPGTQFDGVGNPISYDGAVGANPGGAVATPTGLRAVDSNIGGGIDIAAGLGQPVKASLINDRGTSKWAGGLTKNINSGTSNFFKLEMGANFTVTTCDFTFNGLIGAVGATYARVRYAFLVNGVTQAIFPALLSQSYVNQDGTILTSATGAKLTTTTSTPTPASGALPAATVSVSFSNQNSANTIEGQAECSGGTFRLYRITN